MPDTLATRSPLADFRLDTTGRTPAYFATKAPIIASRNDLVRELKAQADKLRSDIRLCLHRDPSDLQHDMFIVEHFGRYYPPHCHEAYPHAIEMIEGLMASFVFDEHGNPLCVTRLDPSEQSFCYMGAGQFHCEMPLTHQVVYRETKPGPFVRDNIKFGSWAPPLGAARNGLKYLFDLLKEEKIVF